MPAGKARRSGEQSVEYREGATKQQADFEVIDIEILLQRSNQEAGNDPVDVGDDIETAEQSDGPPGPKSGFRGSGNVFDGWHGGSSARLFIGAVCLASPARHSALMAKTRELQDNLGMLVMRADQSDDGQV